MATLYSTGAVQFFVAPFGAAAGAASFLGTAEVEPELQIDRQWSPVFNDLGGRKIPFDMIYDGKQVFVFGDINRFNYAVYAALEVAPVGNRNAVPVPFAGRGTDQYGAVGSLMLTEGKAFTLFLKFDYGTKVVYQNNQMPLGFRFPGTIFRGPDRNKMGTRETKIQMIFQCLRVPQVTSLNTFSCWDHNIEGLPVLD